VTPTQVRATPLLLLLLLLLFPAAQMPLRRRRRPAPHSDKTRMRVIAASLSINLKKMLLSVVDQDRSYMVP